MLKKLKKKLFGDKAEEKANLWFTSKVVPDALWVQSQCNHRTTEEKREEEKGELLITHECKICGGEKKVFYRRNLDGI